MSVSIILFVKEFKSKILEFQSAKIDVLLSIGKYCRAIIGLKL